MTAAKIESLTKFAVKMVPDAVNVTVTESAGVLWVGCDNSAGKRRSRPIGTEAMPTNYLKDEIRRWATEVE
jgi:hypothetical protein